jgi:SAM-dependent methyltransferase
VDDQPRSAVWRKENLSTWDERATIHMRDTTGFYALDRFRAGEDVLMPIESEEIGDVKGKHVLHLQCHIGLDVLSLARRGAIVTGLDFSSEAINAARALAKEAKIDATFIQADVYDAPYVLDGGFDIVFVNWGSLNWLPDINAWAYTVAELLAPGGCLYLVEQHPSLSVMQEIDGMLTPSVDWRTPYGDPNVTDMPTSYNGDDTHLVHTRLHEWEHPLSDIIGSLLEADMRLDFFHEHEVLPWQRLKMMVPTEDERYFQLPEDQPRMPLGFSLKAYKSIYRSW